jgi:hypothetical protein
MKVLAAFSLPDVSAHEIIQIHRRCAAEHIREWSQLKDDEAGLDFPCALVVDAMLFRLGALAR